MSGMIADNFFFNYLQLKQKQCSNREIFSIEEKKYLMYGFIICDKEVGKS